MTSGTAPSIPQGADRKKVLDALRDDGQDYEGACGLLGIPGSTAWYWWNRGKLAATEHEEDEIGGTRKQIKYAEIYRAWYKDCRAAIADFDREMNRTVADGARGDVDKDRVTAAGLYLRHRSKAWKQRHEVTGEDGKAIKVEAELTPEARAKYEAILEAYKRKG